MALLEGRRDRQLAPVGPRYLPRLRGRPVGGRHGADPRREFRRPEPDIGDHDPRRHGEPGDDAAPRARLRRARLDRRGHAAGAARSSDAAAGETRSWPAPAVGRARRAGVPGGAPGRRHRRGDRRQGRGRLRPAARRAGRRCRGQEAEARSGRWGPGGIGRGRDRRAATERAMTTMSAAFLSDPAERLRASVVGIANGRRGRRAAGGAAIAWSGDLFVTSAHVVTGPHATIVTPDGRALPGEVVRRDAERDIAVVRAAGAGVPAAVAGAPYALRAGSLLFAVGHPFGVRDAVSVGVLQAVSPLPRRDGPDGTGAFVWIQADVRLAPGNSGGPLGDAQGRVIGVAAMVASGIALAVPVPDVEPVLSGLT